METRKVEVRFATQEDLIAFYGEIPLKTVRAFVAVVDGVVIGVGGISLDENVWRAFADVTELIPKKQIGIGIRLFKKMIKDTNLPIIATKDATKESADRFLAHLGFVPIGDGEYLCLG